jgi:TM2 domain-containing membrane protein YozV
LAEFILQMKNFFILVFAFFACSISCSAKETGFDSHQNLEIVLNNNLSFSDSVSAKITEPSIKENKKLMAATINLTLGMLGAHRLYLGTKPHVPVFYLLTFGGVFFILPIIDFFVLTFSKDITPYQNNNKIIMWLNP